MTCQSLFDLNECDEFLRQIPLCCHISQRLTLMTECPTNFNLCAWESTNSKVYLRSNNDARQTKVRRTFGYSYRRHSMGSRRDAFRAGQTPKINPTPIDTVRPLTTAHIGIDAGMLGIKKIRSLLIPTDSTTPRTPPRNV